MNWPVKKLAELAAKEPNSFVDGPFGSDLKTTEYVNEGLPLIRIQNVKPGYFLQKDIKYITPAKAEELNRHNYQPGDIVITKLGDPGIACIVPADVQPGIIVADIVRFRGQKDKIDYSYLVHFLNSPASKAQIAKYAKGTTRTRINLGSIKNIEIPLPPLPEQRRIAAVLDAADGLRAKRRAALAKLDALLQSVFLEMFGDPVRNERGWEEGKLGDVIFAAQDGPHVSPEYTESGTPFLSTRNIRPGKIIWDDLKYLTLEDAHIQWKKCRPEKGDILYTKGGTTGLAKVVDFDTPFAVWVHIAVLKTNKNLVDPKWLECMLNTPFCYAQSQRYTHGIANRDLGLTRMVNIKLYIPPLKTQKLFANIAFQIESMLKRAEESKQKFGDLFASLQQRAFRGEL